MLYAKDIANDWVKVGTMLVVSNWLGGGSVFDRSWQKNSAYTLMGFTAYHLSTRNFLTPSGLEGPVKAIVDDTIKVGTMLMVSRLLSGDSLADSNWLAASLATLVGFAVYNLVVSRYVVSSELTNNGKLQNVVDDWAKVGTMLVVSRLISCESVLDPKWVSSTLNTLVGFTAYDLVTSHVTDAVF